MFKNYIKTAIRNLRKNRVISIINLLGLTIGITFSILVYLFVKHEYSYDAFHQDSDLIYRVLSNSVKKDSQSIMPVTPLILAEKLLTHYPEFEYVTRVTYTPAIIKKNENDFEERIYFVENSHFNIFSFPIMSGSETNPIPNINSVIISEEMARKYFPDDNPVGEVISAEFYEEKRDMTITGIFDNKKAQSSIEYDFIASFEIYQKRYEGTNVFTSYSRVHGQTFAKLKEKTDYNDFSDKLSKFDSMIDMNLSEGSRRIYLLQPITDMYFNKKFSKHWGFPFPLGKSSKPIYSYILSGLGLLVLIIACINFVTLTLGHSSARTKEIGIRKVSGAHQSQLAYQYISEAVVISFIALCIGIVLSYFMLPVFSELANKDILFKPNISFFFTLVIIAFMVGISAGTYPAIILSRFNPIKVLKGSKLLNNRSHFSKSLIVLQFTFSVFLIIATLVMRTQLSYMTEMDLGFDQERLVEIELNTGSEDPAPLFERFKNELQNNSSILNIAGAQTGYGEKWSLSGMQFTDDDYKEFYYNTVDHNYIKTMDLTLVKGRDFAQEIMTDENQAVIVNEKFLEYFDIDDPMDNWIKGEFKDNPKIIGVVKDFHFNSLHEEIQPVALVLKEHMFDKEYTRSISYGRTVGINQAVIRIKPGEIMPVLTLIKKKWSELSSDILVDIRFVDETVNALYQSEKRWGEIVSYSSILAIFIAALGLFGLSILTVSKRKKEIGIRKVLGASESKLFYLITKDLFILVAIANVCAWPVAFYVMNQWLENFAYRIEMQVTFFIISGAITLLLTILTVSIHTGKASRANPVDSLRSE